MRILVLGGYGLIGSAVVTRCLAAGHAVTGLGRDVRSARRRHPDADWIERDIAGLVAPEDWTTILTGFDAVVNCSGALQDGPRDDVRAVQAVAMRALFACCRRLDIRRVVQVSAAGASHDAPTEFMRSKAEADTALAALDCDWVILRPGLVLAPVSYGATGLIRGLASLPVACTGMHSLRPIQTVHVEEVARAVLLAVEGGIAARALYDLVEERGYTLPDIVAAYRAWLGRPPAWLALPVPSWLLGVGFRMGDLVGRLGWRTPIRTTALRQIEAGIGGDPSAWERAAGSPPSSLSESLRRMPSGVQERWFGRLWLLKPAILVTLSLFWLLSGLIALTHLDAAMAAMTAHGIDAATARVTVLAGILVDLALGAAILVRRTMPLAALGMAAMTGIYLFFGSAIAAGLWLDPLGAYLKTLPGAMLALVAYALADER
ncbi:SDR family oxidoreductase [Methylobacterium sp. E-045]|uniref:SDR family oxidoreductase n=1 Tax=Methylobacterium sp. E-045 TaxID=2836575 RepID=UPI001FB88FFA|nr:SDR family oxidoreductase [Methylobacterium sp. E-045]MCJ2128931.1 SDR family oxidoreductase [Methylobacterium sp. E-045]